MHLPHTPLLGDITTSPPFLHRASINSTKPDPAFSCSVLRVGVRVVAQNSPGLTHFVTLYSRIQNFRPAKGKLLKACLHRAFAFAIFCIIQCRKRFHPSLVSMGDANANARCKQGLMFSVVNIWWKNLA